jgi:putative flippase GtrA
MRLLVRARAMTLNPEIRRFAMFLAAGGTAAIVNIVSRIAINLIVSYEIAIVLAYLAGMTVAYTLNKYFVFLSPDRKITAEYARFALVNLAGVVQVWCVSVGLARLLFPAIGFAWHAETVAHIIGVASPVYTSYIGHKYFSFGESAR